MGEWSLCRENMEGRTEVAEDGLSLVFYGLWSSLWGPWGTTEFLSRHSYSVCALASSWGFPGGASGKEPACQCRRCKRLGFSFSWSGRSPSPLEEGMATTPVFLAGESHGQRSLVVYGPQGRKETAKVA